MAYAKQLTADAEGKLTGRIGGLFERHDVGDSDQAPPELAESFGIFSLTTPGIKKATQEGIGLAEVIQGTGRWHHQILAGGKPVGFATSIEPSGKQEDWSVQSAFVSELAAKIEDAVQQIDAQWPEDTTEVRFVVVPAYHLHFFLIESKEKTKSKKTTGKKPLSKKPAGKSEVFVIDSPFSSPGPEQGKLYEEHRFLESLQAVPRVRGIVPQPGKPKATPRRKRTHR